MQTVCVQRMFGMSALHAGSALAEEVLGARAEALRAHGAMNRAEARLGRRLFRYGLTLSSLLLLGAYLFVL